jgi:hypothetical protein
MSGLVLTALSGDAVWPALGLMTTVEFFLMRDSTPPKWDRASSTILLASVPLTIETMDFDMLNSLIRENAALAGAKDYFWQFTL